MIQVLVAWLFLCSIFMGFPSMYYLYMKRVASRPWRLITDKTYSPTISILVPTYNEADVIGLKLSNLKKLKYPKNLTQIILIDSGSKDNTTGKILEFLEKNPGFKLKLIEEEERKGKSKGLNFAMERATGEVIVVSDADCFLPPDILTKALPHLADPAVGAIVGREVILNSNQSWVTRNEALYRDLTSVIRLGESKFYSTIVFEGGFSAYKRAFLEEFDCETGCDDTGTALKVVQKNVRTILVPEATFFTTFPPTWKGKVTIKIRRAGQLCQVWTKCLLLLLKGELVLPRRIALSEIFLHIFNPVIFVLLTLATVFVVLEQPFFLLGFLCIIAVPKIRSFFLETLQDNIILLGALVSSLANRKFVIWRKADESRQVLTPDLLTSRGLI